MSPFEQSMFRLVGLTVELGDRAGWLCGIAERKDWMFDSRDCKFAERAEELGNLSSVFRDSLENAAMSPVEFTIYERPLRHKLDCCEKRIRDMMGCWMVAMQQVVLSDGEPFLYRQYKIKGGREEVLTRVMGAGNTLLTLLNIVMSIKIELNTLYVLIKSVEKNKDK